jgi:hypothetical protein
MKIKTMWFSKVKTSKVNIFLKREIILTSCRRRKTSTKNNEKYYELGVGKR